MDIFDAKQVGGKISWLTVRHSVCIFCNHWYNQYEHDFMNMFTGSLSTNKYICSTHPFWWNKLKHSRFMMTNLIPTQGDFGSLLEKKPRKIRRKGRKWRRNQKVGFSGKRYWWFRQYGRALYDDLMLSGQSIIGYTRYQSIPVYKYVTHKSHVIGIDCIRIFIIFTK